MMGGVAVSHLLELCAGSKGAVGGLARFSCGAFGMGISGSVMIARFPSRFTDLFFWLSSAPNGERAARSTRGTEMTKNQFVREGFIRSGVTVCGGGPVRYE